MKVYDKKNVASCLQYKILIEALRKAYGLVVVPCYDRVGISTSKRINAVVDTVFNKGEPAISVASR